MATLGSLGNLVVSLEANIIRFNQDNHPMRLEPVAEFESQGNVCWRICMQMRSAMMLSARVSALCECESLQLSQRRRIYLPNACGPGRQAALAMSHCKTYKSRGARRNPTALENELRVEKVELAHTLMHRR